MSIFSETNANENMRKLKLNDPSPIFHQFLDKIGKEDYELFSDNTIDTIINICEAKTLRLKDFADLASLANFHPFAVYMNNTRPCESKELTNIISIYVESICFLRNRRMQAPQIFNRLLFLLKSTFAVPFQGRNYSLKAQCNLRLDSDYRLPKKNKVILMREIQQLRCFQNRAVLNAEKQTFTFQPTNGRVNLEGTIVPDLITANILLQFTMLNEADNQGINTKPYLNIPEDMLREESL